MKRYSPLLMLLVLLGVLAVSQVATAASPTRPTSTFAHPTLRDDAEAEDEDELEAAEDEFEFEFEECGSGAEDEFEFDEEEGEEWEEEEFEEVDCADNGGKGTKAAPKGAPFVTAPAACQVRQAESTITTLPGSDAVRLDIRYQTWSPTPVTVGLKLKDHKGSLALEHASKRLAGKGVLHLTTKLGASAMDRAAAASEFDVSLRAPQTPAYCAGALEQQLHSAKSTSARASRVYSN
jgi:methionine-rich copper-binding protein CopC